MIKIIKRKHYIRNNSITFYYQFSMMIKKTKNGQFDIVTKDKNKIITDNIINEEINQLTKLNINYYNLGFI